MTKGELDLMLDDFFREDGNGILTEENLKELGVGSRMGKS